jgi:hypothetical protein
MMKHSTITLFVAVAALAVKLCGCGEPTSHGAAQKVAGGTARATLTVSELKQKAENYSGSIVNVTGGFQKYQEARPLSDGPMIWLGDSVDGAVLCVFPRSEDAKLQSISVGQTVTIKGKATTVLGKPALKNCTLNLN